MDRPRRRTNLAGYIERLGTGTVDMIRTANEQGLPAPEFIQADEFKTVICKATEQATEQAQSPVERLILIINGAMTMKEMMKKLNLKHRPTFLYEYLKPAIENELMEMTIPDKPNSPKQKYVITEKGRSFFT